MDNLRNTREELHKEDYNAEPVSYCKLCLSLAIRVLYEDTDYCDDCGSTTIEQTDIASWEKMYKEKYSNTLI